MTKIYLIRHGEAEGNLYRIWQGASEGKITERGRLQLNALSDRFRTVDLDALYTSDLERAKDTALAVAAGHPGLSLEVRSDLEEINVGPWEETAFANTVYKYPEQMEYFNNDPARFYVPGAETFADVLDRMKKAILEIVQEHAGQTVAVVSHGMAIRTLLSWILQIPSKEMRSFRHGDNTSVSLIVADGGKFSTEYIHDTSHLTDSISTLARQNWYKNSSGRNTDDLRDEPLRFPADSLLYVRCYEDSWEAAHGSKKGFVAAPYLTAARKHLKTSPDSIQKLYCGEDLAGLLEMDVERGAEIQKGWVSLLYLKEEYRNRGLGIQLLGRAVLYFRKLGRDGLRLHVAKDNERAVSFYIKNGFRLIETKEGIVSDLFLMEKDL